MKIRVKLGGDIRRLQNDISTAKVTKVIADVDAELGELTKATTQKMANRAPVATGLLKNTISDSAHHAGALHWQILANLDTVPYYWRQNFEHKNKRYYVTIPVNEAEMEIVPRLQRVVDKAW